MRNEFLMVMGLVLAVGAVGCGDDTSSGDGADSGTDASVVTKVDSGSTSDVDSGNTTFSGKCGAVTCPTGQLGMGCCTADGTGKSGDPYELAGRGPGLCGTDIGSVVPSLIGVCLQVEQPGELDANCPTVSNGFADEPGCCTDVGLCGTISAPGPSGANLGCHFPMGGKGKPCGDNADGGAADGG